MKKTKIPGPSDLIGSLSVEELRSLADENGEHLLSLYLPTAVAGPGVAQNPIRFKNLVRGVERELDGRVGRAALALLEPLAKLVEDGAFWRHQGRGLAILRDAERIRCWRLPYEPAELAVTGSRFMLRPLLPLVAGNDHYYVLGLGREFVRLWRGDRWTIEERVLGPDVPRRIEDVIGTDFEPKSIQWHTRTPHGPGGSRAAMFHGHGAAADEQDLELREFLLAIARNIGRYLEPKAPLVVCGLEEIGAMFREVAAEPGLVDEPITIHPPDLTPEELRERAWRVAAPVLREPQTKAAARFAELAGTGRATSDLAVVVAAAADGRVETLLYEAAAPPVWGRWDPAARRVLDAGDGEREDLLDRAAIETLRHGGRTFPVEAGDMPGSGSVAAVLRY
jgi:hypothetical protein